MVTKERAPENRSIDPQVEQGRRQEAEATLLAHLSTGDEATFVGLGNMVVPGMIWRRGSRWAAKGKTDGPTGATGSSGSTGSSDNSGNTGNTALAERLAALGFVPGASISVESNSGRGPVIVNVRGARVAIGRGQACKMLVRRWRVTR